MTLAPWHWLDRARAGMHATQVLGQALGQFQWQTLQQALPGQAREQGVRKDALRAAARQG